MAKNIHAHLFKNRLKHTHSLSLAKYGEGFQREFWCLFLEIDWRYFLDQVSASCGSRAFNNFGQDKLQTDQYF